MTTELTKECYPKISIIMGIYNCSTTLGEAIESIISQTYPNWELVMCDDGSSDDTYSVAEHYYQRCPNRIVLIRNEKNMHLSYTLNKCLEYATGQLIARMDGDDISCPERLMKEYVFLKDHPDIDLVGTAMQQFNGDKKMRVPMIPSFPDKYFLKKDVPFNHATILTYKYVYDTVGGYTVSKRTNRAQDYDLWFKFFYHGFAGANINKPLYLVREDEAAIRRRTPKSRYYRYQTTRIGYKLLGFPKTWLIKPFFSFVLKSLTPFFVVDFLRKLQAKGKKECR